MMTRMNARHGPDAGPHAATAAAPHDVPPAWLPGPGTTVMVVSGSPALHGEVGRVCAAAAVELVIAETVDQSGGRWADMAAVLIGSDVPGGLPGWRGPTVVVGPAGDAGRMWLQASRLGADRVAVLPDSAQWLANYFTRLREPAAGPGIVGIVGGCGGAGASTLAALVAGQAASRGIRVLLVDGDPWGGNLDAAVAADALPGLRWPDLLHASGAINPEQLAASLPQLAGMSLLSWGGGAEAGGGDRAAAEAEVMRAARDAYGLVVVDVGRSAGPADGLGMHCDGFVMLVPARLRAAAAAQRVLQALPAAPVGLVVAGPLRNGVDAHMVSDAVGVPLVGHLPRIKGMEEALDAGRLPDLARHRQVRRLAGGVLGWLAGDASPEPMPAGRGRRGR
ncbi:MULTISPECIES: septum site-determining protein Ssd [unclassified Arthrobacter]|uniref:septum site-determining protein Ssd n=1 Tax=unclassified Arthrobacter TaxID=235627 RepID=UPI00159E9F2A|nr:MULTISPECIES: septum site-determining protein Ssd [unclassified Arthrobacter]MCQ9165158.1 hypothetical protein [Arthrobacter sp. STN4]NVM99749.1 hypothetical protein [Arthrobacter sp. SDTb3-6]